MAAFKPPSWSSIRNFLHFYRRNIGWNFMGVSLYISFCYRAKSWENETLRMGVAGSIAHGTVEAAFHFFDTVNISAKANEAESHSTSQMVRRIYAKEGVVGFSRGIGAAMYGSYTSGFVYFIIYKWLKSNIPELGGFKNLLAGMIAETTAIMVKFPFDLIKCRLQSVNFIFKYSNWTHGLGVEYRKNGVRGLYSGALPYMVTYTTFTALQFSIYEWILVESKRRVENYAKWEFYLNMMAGCIGGGAAAAVTNGFEALTVQKQTQPDAQLMKLVQSQGLELMTKGLVPRVGYNACQSIVLFGLIKYIGKAYNVQLEDD